MLTVRDLTGSSQCTKRRSHSKLNLSKKESKTTQQIRAVKAAIGKYFTEGPYTTNEAAKAAIAEVEAFLVAELDDIRYSSAKTKELQTNKAVKEVKRYLQSEKRLPLMCDAKNITLTINGQANEIHIHPTMIFINKNSIEVVDVLCKSPKYDTRTEIELKEYLNMKYAEEFIPKAQAQKWVVRSSLYYLRKDNDSNSLTTPRFDLDFWDDAGHNVKYMETEVECPGDGTLINPLDAEYLPMVETAIKGKTECTKEDCEACALRHLCNYTAPPTQLVKEKKVRSLSELTLSPAQKQAIEITKDIWRINAGAGAGKTLVVALRVVTLLLKGVKPEEILLMTFTNTGAEEMKERIALYNDDFGNGDDISALTCCTFNSFGDLILKEEYARFGFSKPPVVIDDIQRSVIIAKLLADNPIEGLDYMNFATDLRFCQGALAVARRVFDLIKKNSYTKADADVIYKEISARFCKDISAIEQLIDLYQVYDANLKAEGLIEYADQEVLIWQLLAQDPYYLDRFGYKHIIVDEFQDSSKGQINLIQILTESPTFESLMVVGDDSQGTTCS